jgi:alpha-galactosidase
MADAMVASGLDKAGYKYIVIDDCWSNKTRIDGKLSEDKDRFPSGMKAMSDYIHSKGNLLCLCRESEQLIMTFIVE